MEAKSNKQAKKRIFEEKTVVRVKLDEVKGEDHQLKKEKVEVDSWKWRKCGQKTIKTSPVIRNYYRCTTKGCSAKKQVEVSQEDGSTSIITYISSHNHPGLGPNIQTREKPSPMKKPKAQTRKKPIKKGGNHIDILNNQEEKPYVVKLDTLNLHQPTCNNFLQQEHNTLDLDDIVATDCDFFQELNELQIPTSSLSLKYTKQV